MKTIATLFAVIVFNLAYAVGSTVGPAPEEGYEF